MADLNNVINQIPDNVATEIVAVTPDIAKKYLEHNHNRTLRPTHVHKLAKEMEAGKWTFTHEAIAFRDVDGSLLDGQHRLHAVISSGCTVAMLVIHGISEDAWGKMNRGIKRTTADEFSRRGHANASKIAAATRLMWRYANDDWRRDVDVADDELLRFYEQKYPDIGDFAPAATEFSREVDITWSVALVCLYLSAQADLSAVNKDYAEWEDEVVRGVGVMTEGSPSRQLRRQLRKRVEGKLNTTQRTTFGLYARAWTAWAQGRSVKALRFTDRDLMPYLEQPLLGEGALRYRRKNLDA